jgi:transcription elongation factor Elf1
MNKQQLKSRDNLRKKLGCQNTDCGQYITLTATEEALKLAGDRQKVYALNCSKCSKLLKLTKKEAWTLESVYSKVNYQIIQSNFDELFEEKD